MAKKGYLSMVTDQTAGNLQSDWNDLSNAASKLVNDAVVLGGLGIGTAILQWVATIAALYLLVLDRTNWKTNILTGLLVPYIFFCLPPVLFNFFSGEVGKWIAFIAIILRLFFPRHFPDWLELPAALILLLVVAPSFFADTLRDGVVGVIICILIGIYLLQEHIRAAGGFRNSFTRPHGISNTLGIICLFIYPVWALIIYFL